MLLSPSVLRALEPRAEMDAAQWAEEYAYLPGETLGGKIHLYPYQPEMLRAMTPTAMKANGKMVWRVTIPKSTRTGYTKTVTILICFHIDQRPTSIAVYTPDDKKAREWMKEELSTMVDATPCLTGQIATESRSDGKSTLLHRLFLGGVVSAAGVVNPANLRQISRQVVIFDDRDAFKRSLGAEGDPVRLGINRTTDYWNRMVVSGSSPAGNKKDSRIWQEYQSSDQRRFMVPCPHCGHRQHLRWEQFWWPEGQPQKVTYRCEKCDRGIDYGHQRAMVAEGYWEPQNPHGDPGHAGFHIWAAYSPLPNCTWEILAAEHDRTRHDRNEHRAWVNTVLGIPWASDDEADLDVGDLLERLDGEHTMGTCPPGVVLLTAGVDVQGGGGSVGQRLEVSIWGWGEHEEAWLIWSASIAGDPVESRVWEQLATLLEADWPTTGDGPPLKVRQVAIDSGGHAGDQVAEVCRRNRHWQAVKGSPTVTAPTLRQQAMTAAPRRGKALFRRQQLVILGTCRIKDTLYGRLSRLMTEAPSEARMHLPIDTPNEVAEQLVAERRELTPGSQVARWTNKAGRANEAWDCAVYAYAAMRMVVARYDSRSVWKQLARRAAPPAPPDAEAPTPQPRRRGGWMTMAPGGF